MYLCKVTHFFRPFHLLHMRFISSIWQQRRPAFLRQFYRNRWMRQLFLSLSSGRNSLLRASHHYLWKLCHSDRKTGEPRGGLLLLHEQKNQRFEQKFGIFVKHFARATLSHLSLMVVIWASHEVTRSRGLWLQPHFFDLNFNILSAPFSFNILPKTEMNSYRSFSGFSTLLEVCIISSIPSNGKKTLIVFF